MQAPLSGQGTARQWLWPLSAVMSWALCWLLFLGAVRAGWDSMMGLALASLVGAGLACLHERRWRRVIVGLGFPVSVLLQFGPAALQSPWLWAALLVLLLLLYPRRNWRDAPMFPTPHGALDGLKPLIALRPDARLLDAGCGMGHGLQALRRVFPDQPLVGLEWSRLLCWLARWRCPSAQILRGDMWAHDWRPYELVYCFQRPESMAQVLSKARAELRPGAWLVSLDFELPELNPIRRLPLDGRHQLFVYRL